MTSEYLTGKIFTDDQVIDQGQEAFQAGSHGSGIEDRGDVRVIHERERLPLGIEAGELAELFLWRSEEEVEAALQDPAGILNQE